MCPKPGCDKGPWDDAQLAYVVGSGMHKLFHDFDNIQEATWGWGVFFASDANSADYRCTYLEEYKGYDCPGYWLPFGGAAKRDSTKRGAGYFPAGNPDAIKGRGGGGTGCHFDHQNPTNGIDQTDAVDASGSNIVIDANCQCNYNLKGNFWQDWVDQWLAHAAPKNDEQWQYWFKNGKAPSYALDFAACWLNNPRDMIQLQNALWRSRFDWSNQQIPRSSWDKDPYAASQRVYWGWNEVPVNRTVMDDSQNWDAVVIKLPAAVCPGAVKWGDSVSCLSMEAQGELEKNLDNFVSAGLLKPGLENAHSHPGSSVVFLREEPDKMMGGWVRNFYCEGFTGPQGKWEVGYNEPEDVCYLYAAKPTPAPPSHWSQHERTNCYQDHGAVDLETPPGSSSGQMDLDACKNYCLTHPSRDKCTAISYDDSKKLCYRRREVALGQCVHMDGYETWTTN